MGDGGHNEPKFKAAILALSVASDWDDAKSEWLLDFVYVDPADRACECEHSPIHQICVIKNRRNGSKTEVGNVCVRRFLRLLSNRIFSVLKRLKFDINKSLNPAALDIFMDRGVLSAAEVADYVSYWRKRTTMTKQEAIQKLDINRRVLRYFTDESDTMIARARQAGLHFRVAQKL